MLRYVIGLSILTLALLLIRYFANSRISKRLQYFLWILVPLYMVVAPFYTINITVPAKEIIVNEQVENAERTDTAKDVENIQTNPDLVPKPLDEYEKEPDIATSIDTEVIENVRTINWDATTRNIALLVAIILITFVALYNLGFVIYCSSKRSFIGIDSASNLKIYRLNHSSSPFLLGNNIYLSDKVANSDMAQYAICHEYCHYKHLDPLWTAIRFLVLALNWYNPLIWYAFVIVEQDCELACDEAVLSILGEDKSIEYGKVLLSLLSDKSFGKHDFYLSTAMNGRSKKFMKDRITNIKHSKKYGVIPVAITIAISLIMAGCSLVEFNEETKDSENASEHIETVNSVESEIDLIETDESAVESETVFPSETNTVEFLQIPEVNRSMEDGYYTVSMTPINAPTEDGYDTCTVYPWTQYEVDQAFIDSLEIGQVIDLSGYDGFSSVTIEDMAIIGIEPEIYLGTSYTGTITNLTTNVGFMNFYHVEGTDTWKLFAEGNVPVVMYSDPIRLVISDDCVIYDASNVFNILEYNGQFTQEKIEDILQFRDTSLTAGNIENVSDFWFFADNADSRSSTYNTTVVRIENNEVTEIYFWYAS